MQHAPALLAQTAGAVALPALGIILLIGGGVFALRALRRSMIGGDAEQSAALPFSLQRLREMRTAGEITEAEFERTREMIIRATRDASERRAEPLQGPPPIVLPDSMHARPGFDLTGAPLPRPGSGGGGKPRTPGNTFPNDAAG